MSITSEELIRRVRAAKTPAQELAFIETELCAIRSSLKLREQPHIARNVAKLVYASMRGLNVTWGDIGVVNLCQSAKSHKEKRLAYLALQITSHDNPQYLKMASNSIKTDMESGSQYRASVALCALAAVGTPDMLSELSTSTLQLLKNKDSIYIRKKAFAVAIRTVKVAPEVCDQFVEPCIAGILDKSHTIPLGAVQLAFQLVTQLEEPAEKFFLQLKSFLKLLQELQQNPTGNDHEMGGVNDPALQTAILRFLAALLKKVHQIDDQSLKLLSETLENVVSAQHKKGESVLARVSVQFEAARTILEIPSQLVQNKLVLQNLRAAAADALTAALDHKNQTVRYSALASITEIIHKTGETQGAQRHRQTVLSCMQEESITLRRRALNLLILITDKESSLQIVQSLLDLIGKKSQQRYLQIKSSLNEDIKKEIINSVAFIAESFAEDPQWHFDVLFACLQLYGNGKLNEDLVQKITAHLAREKSIQQYACQKLGELFVECQTFQQLFYNETLIAACLYCIGECASLIQEPQGIISTIYMILEGPMYSQVLIRYAVSTVAKMYTKCQAAQQQCSQFLQKLQQDSDPEIQQRAYEYSIAITEPKAAGLLGAIPPPPRIQSNIKQNEYERPKPVVVVQQIIPTQNQQLQQPQLQQQQQTSLPLPVPNNNTQIQAKPMGQFSSMVPGQMKMPAPSLGAFGAKPVQKLAPAPQIQPVQQADDLLDMGGPATQVVQKQGGPDLMDDLLGGPSQPAQQQYQQQPQNNQQQAQQQQNQHIQGQPKQLYVDNLVSFVMKAQGTQHQGECQFMITGIGNEDVKVRAQYAAQQGVQLSIGQVSGDQIGPGKPPIQQVVKISGNNLAMKIKFQYIMLNGGQKEQMITIQNIYQ